MQRRTLRIELPAVVLTQIPRNARCVTGLTGVRTCGSTGLPEGAQAWVESIEASPVLDCETLAGGAGRRRYWRLRLGTARTLILMWARNEDPAILPPALRDQNAGEAFAELTEIFGGAGIPVPELHAFERGRSWLLLEDLGGCHLLDLDGPEQTAARDAAIDLLARFHQLELPPEARPCRRAFDREWVLFELQLFADRTQQRSRVLQNALDQLALAIEALGRCVCMRDFQSHNLMLDAHGRLRVIDYQDALMAPPELDLAALLFDSYVPYSSGERERLRSRYERATGHRIADDALALLTLQRKCKDASRFHLLVTEQADSRFEAAFERAQQAAGQALEQLTATRPAIAEPIRQALEALSL